MVYSKVPKFSDARKLCGKQPKIQTKRTNLRIFCQKDANGIIANSKNPNQSSLIWVCTVCLDLSVRKLKIIMVTFLNTGASTSESRCERTCFSQV